MITWIDRNEPINYLYFLLELLYLIIVWIFRFFKQLLTSFVLFAYKLLRLYLFNVLITINRAKRRVYFLSLMYLQILMLILNDLFDFSFFLVYYISLISPISSWLNLFLIDSLLLLLKDLILWL
jgi:hypothetical protein